MTAAAVEVGAVLARTYLNMESISDQQILRSVNKRSPFKSENVFIIIFLFATPCANKMETPHVDLSLLSHT